MIQPAGMSQRLASDRRDNFIRVAVGKSCYLLLTWAEYTAGIQRGKRERRALRMAQSGKQLVFPGSRVRQ